MSIKNHLEAAAAYIAVAESGDAKREAYLKAADEMIAAQAEDPKLSQAEIGRQIGKSESWVSDLLKWRRLRAHEGGLPFARGEAQQRYVERKVPTRHEDKVEMATKLLADPKVAKAAAKTVLNTSTAAGRILAQTAHDNERESRQQSAARNRGANAAPLPLYMAKMVTRINEMANELDALHDDLDSLPEGQGRDLILVAIRHLATEAQRWVDYLEDNPIPGTIDVTVSRPLVVVR